MLWHGRGTIIGVSAAFRVAETVDTASMEQRKPGRPSKGPRSPLHCKVPDPLLKAARARAAAKGMSLTDLVGELLARETGMTYEAQEVLELTA